MAQHGESDKVTLPSSVRSANIQQDLGVDFRNYLSAEGQSRSSIRDKVSYAKRYHHVLGTGNAAELQPLSADKKSHAMKALASLAKFTGRYDEWLDTVKRYHLKWSNGGNSLKAFKNIFDSGGEGKNLESMIGWIRNVSSTLPAEYRNVLLFNALTGPGPDDAQKAIYLIKTMEDEYLDTESGILKHYQFRSTFQRQTNNAYISVVNRYI